MRQRAIVRRLTISQRERDGGIAKRIIGRKPKLGACNAYLRCPVQWTVPLCSRHAFCPQTRDFFFFLIFSVGIFKNSIFLDIPEVIHQVRPLHRHASSRCNAHRIDKIIRNGERKKGGKVWCVIRSNNNCYYNKPSEKERMASTKSSQAMCKNFTSSHGQNKHKLPSPITCAYLSNATCSSVLTTVN